MNYIFVAEFDFPGPIGIGTGTTNMESLLVSFGASYYSRFDEIRSICEIPELGVVEQDGIAQISDMMFLSTQDGLYEERPEFLLGGFAKIQDHKRALTDRFHRAGHSEAIASIIGRDLTGQSYWNSSKTDPIMNRYASLEVSGFAFLVGTEHPDRIVSLLVGETIGKQWRRRIRTVHYEQTDLSPVRTLGGSPLRPLTVEQANRVGIARGYPLYMGVGVNRKLSHKDWMWNGEIRPYLKADPEDPTVYETITAYCQVGHGEPLIDLSRVDPVYDRFATMIDMDRLLQGPELLKYTWVPGRCAVTKADTLVAYPSAPSKSGERDCHEISFGAESQLIRVLRSMSGAAPDKFISKSEVWGSCGLDQNEVYIGATKQSPAGLSGRTKVIVLRDSRARTELYQNSLTRTDPRILWRIPNNKIDDNFRDLRWSVGKVVFDNTIRDYVDVSVFDQFRQFERPIQEEIVERLRGYRKKNAPLTDTATGFFRDHISRITPTHQMLFSKHLFLKEPA